MLVLPEFSNSIPPFRFSWRRLYLIKPRHNHGDVLQDVRRNDTLCHPDPSSRALLDSKAKQKVLAYRDDYRRPDRSDRPQGISPRHHGNQRPHPRGAAPSAVHHLSPSG